MHFPFCPFLSLFSQTCTLKWMSYLVSWKPHCRYLVSTFDPCLLMRGPFFNRHYKKFGLYTEYGFQASHGLASAVAAGILAMSVAVVGKHQLLAWVRRGEEASMVASMVARTSTAYFESLHIRTIWGLMSFTHCRLVMSCGPLGVLIRHEFCRQILGCVNRV